MLPTTRPRQVPNTKPAFGLMSPRGHGVGEVGEARAAASEAARREDARRGNESVEMTHRLSTLRSSVDLEPRQRGPRECAGQGRVDRTLVYRGAGVWLRMGGGAVYPGRASGTPPPPKEAPSPRPGGGQRGWQRVKGEADHRNTAGVCALAEVLRSRLMHGLSDGWRGGCCRGVGGFQIMCTSWRVARHAVQHPTEPPKAREADSAPCLLHGHTRDREEDCEEAHRSRPGKGRPCSRHPGHPRWGSG